MIRRTSFSSILRLTVCALCVSMFLGATCEAEQYWLSDLDISKTQQDWGSPGKDKSVDGNPLSIGGTTFERGLGTHALSRLYITLNGKG